MNKINLRQLVKKAQLLDNDGNYREADKVFNLVKLSQQQLGEFPLTPEQYQKVIPQFNETYLDYNLNPENASQSTFGKNLVNRPMYDRNSAFFEGEGPDKAFIANMPSEKQYAKLLNDGKFDEIAKIKKNIGEQIQKYVLESSSNLASVSTLIDQYLLAESPAVRESFIQYVLPFTIVGLVANELSGTEMNSWSKKVSSAFGYLESKDQAAFAVLQQSLTPQLQEVVNAKKTTAQGRAEVDQFMRSPEGRAFATKYGIR
jgi:hypothetical protein